MDIALPIHQQIADSAVNLSPEQFYQHDPLLILLKKKLPLNNLLIIILATVLFIVVFFGLIPLAGPYGRHASLLVHTLFRLTNIFVYVLSLVVYLMLPKTISVLFNTLKNNEVVGEPHQGQSSTTAYEDFLRNFVAWATSKWWLIGAFPFAILYFLYRFLVLIPQSVQLFPTLRPAPLWLQLIFVFLDFSTGYMVFLSIVRIAITLVFTHRLFDSFVIWVNPLHSDGRGGLAILGSILWKSAGITLVIALSFFLADSSLPSIPDEVLLITAYALLIPALLIGWLALPRKAMVQARDRVLQPLIDEFKRTLIETKPLPNDSGQTIDAGTEKLSALKRRHEYLNSIFPTSPLEFRAMGRLIAALSLPALLPITANLLDIFANMHLLK